MQDFRDLEAWKKAHRLVLRVYAVTRQLPKEEVFGITMQLRRSAIAVPLRIAEAAGGEAASTPQGFRRAAATTSELEYIVLLAGDLGLIGSGQCDELIHDVIEVRKMLFGLVRSA